MKSTVSEIFNTKFVKPWLRSKLTLMVFTMLSIISVWTDTRRWISIAVTRPTVQTGCKTTRVAPVSYIRKLMKVITLIFSEQWGKVNRRWGTPYRFASSRNKQCSLRSCNSTFIFVRMLRWFEHEDSLFSLLW